MSYVVSILISFFASVIGSICGIGGGVIIKPVMDAFHIYPVSTVSFMSGCIVLSMSAYSVIRSQLSHSTVIDKTVSVWLGIGAAFGGIAGNQLFNGIKRASASPEYVGAIQAAALFLITLATVIYTVNKNKVKSKHIHAPAACCLIGLSLGMISAFLGIGGGPMNLVVLYYFFSMETKVAAQNSLFIILISQAANLIFTIMCGNVPQVPVLLFAGMVFCGIIGGATGRAISKRISGKGVSRLFVGLLCVIMLICCYNFSQFI